MGKVISTRLRAGQKKHPPVSRRVHTESNIDLLDEISARAKLTTLIVESSISILSESLDRLDAKRDKDEAELLLLDELQEAHVARLASLVSLGDDRALTIDKKRLMVTPRPMKRSDRNLYRAISRELRSRMPNE